MTKGTLTPWIKLTLFIVLYGFLWPAGLQVISSKAKLKILANCGHGHSGGRLQMKVKGFPWEFLMGPPCQFLFFFLSIFHCMTNFLLIWALQHLLMMPMCRWPASQTTVFTPEIQNNCEFLDSFKQSSVDSALHPSSYPWVTKTPKIQKWMQRDFCKYPLKKHDFPSWSQ